MSVAITLPRGFDTHAHKPRIVVESLPGAIRLHRAKTANEAMAVQDAWKRCDYARWPGEVRVFPEI